MRLLVFVTDVLFVNGNKAIINSNIPMSLFTPLTMVLAKQWLFWHTGDKVIVQAGMHGWSDLELVHLKSMIIVNYEVPSLFNQ